MNNRNNASTKYLLTQKHDGWLSVSLADSNVHGDSCSMENIEQHLIYSNTMDSAFSFGAILLRYKETFEENF